MLGAILRSGLILAALGSSALAYDASTARRYSSPDMYRPNVDSVIVRGDGSTGNLSGTCVKIAGSSICRAQRDRWTDNQVQAIDFGVKCDGVTDDSSAILGATNFAAALGGRDVMFQPGRCLFKNFILPPNRTRWVSRGGTIFTFDPAMPVGGASKSAIAFENVSDILIDGITFQGNGANTLNCGVGCPGTPRVVAINASNVTIRNTTIRDFGNLTRGSDNKPLAYAQGIVAFAGSNWLVENSRFINNSGDGIAWSNHTDKVEVRFSYFEGNDDSSGPVCTIGGTNFNIHDNEIRQRAGNIAPVVVMDRCTNWQINNNRIYGLPNASGKQTGQAIRVARYTLEDSANVNHSFTIAGNVIVGTDMAISVEGSGTVQTGYKDSNTGQVWPDVSVPGGGRFAVTGNTSVGANTCIQIVDSEMGAVTGNTCTGVTGTGILQIAYKHGTGGLAIAGNTLVGTGATGSFGIRQLASGGTLTPSAVNAGTNMISGFAALTAMAGNNQPLTVSPGVPTDASLKPCTQGQLLGVDRNNLYVCADYGVLGKVPLTLQAQ